MIEEGSKVLIVRSDKLSLLRLDDLIGKCGIVSQVLVKRGRKNKGYIVSLFEPYEGEYCWFIPVDSVVL